MNVTAFLWVLPLLFMVVVACAIALYCEAKGHVDTAPKKEMFLCEKHGAIPAEAAMDINTNDYEFEMETGEVTRGKVLYCPRCFEDRIKEAEKRQ